MVRPNGKSEKPRDAKGTLRRLLDCLMGRRAALGVILVLSLGGNILSLLGPKLAGTAMGAAAAGTARLPTMTPLLRLPIRPLPVTRLLTAMLLPAPT